MKPIVSKRSRIFCAPLKLWFPQIYRLRRTEAGRTTAASSPGFSLIGKAPSRSGMIVEPIRHLTPSDHDSLVLHHHWSRLEARSYLKGIDDGESIPIGGIFVSNDAFFTLVQRTTSPAWRVPTIFYLAELFEDDDFLNAQHWEMSASCDGVIENTDIYFDS